MFIKKKTVQENKKKPIKVEKFVAERFCWSNRTKTKLNKNSIKIKTEIVSQTIISDVLLLFGARKKTCGESGKDKLENTEQNKKNTK